MPCFSERHKQGYVLWIHKFRLHHTPAFFSGCPPKFDFSQRKNVCWSRASSFGRNIPVVLVTGQLRQNDPNPSTNSFPDTRNKCKPNIDIWYKMTKGTFLFSVAGCWNAKVLLHWQQNFANRRCCEMIFNYRQQNSHLWTCKLLIRELLIPECHILLLWNYIMVPFELEGWILFNNGT